MSEKLLTHLYGYKAFVALEDEDGNVLLIEDAFGVHDMDLRVDLRTVSKAMAEAHAAGHWNTGPSNAGYSYKVVKP